MSEYRLYPTREQVLKIWPDAPNHLRAKNWEELDEGDEAKWEEIARKYQQYFQVAEFLSEKGCWKCKAKLKNMVEAEFHFHSTHGIPPEMFRMVILGLGK